jgi:hypothetical protein
MGRPPKDDTGSKKAERPPILNGAEVWEYYRVDFKITREFLGTCSEASIMAEHVLKKAQKEIKKANKLSGAVSKAAEKWKGEELSDDKMVKELQGIITTFAELSGKIIDPMPYDIDDLLELAERTEQEYYSLIGKNEQKATVFMRETKSDGSTWPIISTHMILGNLKENARNITNNGDKSIFPSKVSIGEIMSLDVKPVEQFMKPSHDIVRKENGERDLLERPIRFNRMGKDITAISTSERLPVGTEFGCVLRVRKRSGMTEEALRFLFELGKNNGFGSWRGSGNMGAYRFKLEKLQNYKEPVPPGFEGWS